MSELKDSNKEDWRGCNMKEIYHYLNEYELRHDNLVVPSDTHAVLYHYPIKNFHIPPRPYKGHIKWDALHVRLPCSNKNQYPVQHDDGSTTIELRWKMIEDALKRPIKNSYDLEQAILTYNSKYQNIWKFNSLHQFFEEMDEDEAEIFFLDLLPKIIQLALNLPTILTSAIPLLKQFQNTSITLSQHQIASLLANAFFCTFPRRNTFKLKSEYSTFPDINFNRLFQSTGQNILEKLKCIFHYFRRVCNTPPIGVVTFTRRSVSIENLPDWSKCDAPLGVTPLHVTSVGTIEDQGVGLLQVDFANKFLGGGVLGGGCVQEEIRFVICPELIISKLFTEALRPCEALLIIGVEQYSKYNGYSKTFTWCDNYIDHTPYDESRRRQCHIVAIDALHFSQTEHQYREELILRELNKAYVGFLHTIDTPAPGVASGNWGCGAFRGEATLKALIQLMACTINKRPLVYYTFGNVELRDEFHQIHTFFIEENVQVNQLWKYLKEYGKKKFKTMKLYDFIRFSHLKASKSSNLCANSLDVNCMNKKNYYRDNAKKKLSPPFNNLQFNNTLKTKEYLDANVIEEFEKNFSDDDETSIEWKSGNETEKLQSQSQTTRTRSTSSNDLFDLDSSIELNSKRIEESESMDLASMNNNHKKIKTNVRPQEEQTTTNDLSYINRFYVPERPCNSTFVELQANDRYLGNRPTDAATKTTVAIPQVDRFHDLERIRKPTNVGASTENRLFGNRPVTATTTTTTDVVQNTTILNNTSKHGTLIDMLDFFYTKS